MRGYSVLTCLFCGLILGPWSALSAASDTHVHNHKHDHHHHHHEEEETPSADGQTEAKAAASRQVLPLLAVYCGLIVLASLAGGWIPNRVRLTHTRMQTLISGVGGLMLGIAVFHLLPHSLEYTASPTITSQWLMGGLLVMFFLVRAFHFHHHGPADPLADEESHEHDHDHDDGHHHPGHSHTVHHLNWIGVALGLAIHTLIDGIALGASVRAEFGEPVFLSLFGLGTFLAVLLHKPLDAISITSLMAAGGWSAGARNLVNFGFAMMCPLGALLFVLGVEQLDAHQHFVIGCALAFAAGVFLCISLGDLLPELELHSHNRIRLSVALLLGVALAWAIEQTHSHDHSHTESSSRASETQASREIPA
jgi:zinc and cadmium transporter